MAHKNSTIYRKTHHDGTNTEVSAVTFINESLSDPWGKKSELNVTGGTTDGYSVNGTITLISHQYAWEGSGNHGERVEYPFTWTHNAFDGTSGSLTWGAAVITSDAVGGVTLDDAVTKTAAGSATSLSMSLPNTWFGNRYVECIVEAEFNAATKPT